MFLRAKWLVLFFLFLMTSVQAAPVQKRFSDWQVTCNNQNFCLARNTGNHQNLVMTISRSPGAKTDISLRIDLGNRLPADPALPAIAPRLLLDDQPLNIDERQWQTTAHHLITRDIPVITALLERMSDSTAEKITLDKGAGIISLKGLKSALRFIDTQQKRQGNETAWVKKGDNPALAVPPAPPLKAVKINNPTPTPLTQKELSDLQEYGKQRMENMHCSLDPERRQTRIWVLTDERVLMLINCEMGAYNMIDRAWVVTRHAPFTATLIQLELPFIPAGTSSDELELINTSYDPTRKELITLDKGRESGDCGIATRWRYDGQRFRLVRYAEEACCDGWHDNDDWPTLWVTN